MNISKIKLVWNYLTGGGTKVLDYILDVANNAVNNIDESSKAKVAEVLAAIERILATARSVYWLVPAKWQPAYYKTLDALEGVKDACSDLNITAEELLSVYAAWATAYASWRAE